MELNLLGLYRIIYLFVAWNSDFNLFQENENLELSSEPSLIIAEANFII